MKFKKHHSLLPICLLWVITLVVSTILFQLNAQQNGRLPLDPQIIKGKFENGLQYMIRENSRPENRMELRLIVDAGSLQEDEDQLGLAHFIEHMAFNGTKNFAKNDLVDFLESIGLRFGPDLNAYTSFEETVYMLQVPLDDEVIIEKAFLVLQDWARGITFDQEELDKERGVILEELRLGKGAQKRIMDKQLPVLFHNSRYAKRLPIGDAEIIKNAPREVFLRYYNDWYRPDRMSIVAVGDFDKDNILSLIKKYFSGLENPPAARKNPSNEVPGHTETLFSIETDPELQYTTIGISRKLPTSDQQTYEAYRQSIVDGLFYQILNQRLAERLQEANPPYLYAAGGTGSMVRSKEMLMINSVVRDGLFVEGLKAVLLEWRRIQRDGLTQTELNRAKAGLARSYESLYSERDKSESSSFASEYIRHILEGEAVPGIPKEYEMVNEMLPSISLEEVNATSASLASSENRVIVYSAPEKDGVKVPSKEDILKILNETDAAEIGQYDDGLGDKPLMANEPKPGSIIFRRNHDKIDVREWVLSNRMRVLLKKTNFKNDEILMSASSPGGYSLAEDNDFVIASTADMLVGQGGVDEFSAVDLSKLLSDKNISSDISIGNYSESFSGFASPKDLEYMFQLLHLKLTKPRLDPEVFQSYKVQMLDIIKNRSNNPSYVFSEEIRKAMYGDHPRHKPLDAKWINSLDLDMSYEYYQNRFESLSDYNVAIVGNFEWDKIEEYVRKYLASLPGGYRDEKPIFRKDDPTKGQVNVKVNKGLEDKATVQILMHGDTKWDHKFSYPLRAAVDVLNIRLREVLREAEGGVYGVRASGSLSNVPKGTFRSSISFGCSPANADRLIKLALEEVRKLQTEPASEANIEKVKEIHRRGFETGSKQNSFWTSNLLYRFNNGLDPDAIIDFPSKPEKLKPQNIMDAAKKYFDTSNILIAQLHPEESGSKSNTENKD